MTSKSLERLNQQAKLRGKPFRILVVDDEQWVREVFRDFCNITDAFEVEIAENGEEAVEKVNASTYDLVTLDLIMPELSGLDALSLIKKKSPRLPVMIITGNATDKLVTQAGVLGACKVMYKPIQLETFMAELAATLTA